jgi:deoxycytidylate deaminase
VSQVRTLEKKSEPRRPSWDEYFMQVANVVKSRSTCLSSAKGAVLVSGRQIISTGYNGTPAGTKHCDEGGCARCLAVKEGRLKSGQDLENCACVLGDTILLGDNKPIAEYVVGDSVVGMHQLNDVKETFKIDYSGDLIQIEAKGILPFSLTPEHPLLVINADNRPNSRSPNLALEWKRARDVRERHNRPKYAKGDYLLLPRIAGHVDTKAISLDGVASYRRLKYKIKEFPLNTTTAWLLGVYVAKGYAAQARIYFALHSNERTLAERIVRALGSVDASASVKDQPNEQAICVDCCSAVLGGVMASWCGHLAPNKRIPDFILYHENLKILEAFLKGYSTGDGGWARNNTNSVKKNQLQMVTTSKLLALQLQLAYARLGLYASVYNNHQAGETTIQARAVTTEEAYTIRFSPTNTNVRVFEEDGHRFYMLPIRSVTKTHFVGTVYNLGTAADNTYLISNIVSHNCCHAEENAIVQAAKNGIPTSGCTLYSTHSPCTYCSKMIINAGITKVVASTAYPDQLGVRLMKEAGLQLVII